jgi:hypothetical protein
MHTTCTSFAYIGELACILDHHYNQHCNVVSPLNVTHFVDWCWIARITCYTRTACACAESWHISIYLTYGYHNVLDMRPGMGEQAYHILHPNLSSDAMPLSGADAPPHAASKLGVEWLNHTCCPPIAWCTCISMYGHLASLIPVCYAIIMLSGGGWLVALHVKPLGFVIAYEFEP